MDGIMIHFVGGVKSRTPKAAAKRKRHDDWRCWIWDFHIYFLLCVINPFYTTMKRINTDS